MEIQILRSRYVDKAHLDRLLRSLFGSGNFEVEVSFYPLLLSCFMLTYRLRPRSNPTSSCSLLYLESLQKYVIALEPQRSH